MAGGIISLRVVKLVGKVDGKSSKFIFCKWRTKGVNVHHITGSILTFCMISQR